MYVKKMYNRIIFVYVLWNKKFQFWHKSETYFQNWLILIRIKQNESKIMIF